jgi:hypothetical protein
MKNDQPLHWFNVKLPKIADGEEERFWKHPVYPVQCNQLGMIYIDEGYEIKYQNGKKEAISFRPEVRGKGVYTWIEIGHPHRIMFECWSGTQMKYSAFVFADGNPLNTTPENLVRKGDHDLEKWKAAYVATTDFRTRSLDYMKKRDEILIKRGVSPENYWESFGLPTWLKAMYFKGGTKKVKGIRSPYVQKFESLELMVKITELRQSGKSYREIQEILKLSHINRVKYWLKKAEQMKDI